MSLGHDSSAAFLCISCIPPRRTIQVWVFLVFQSGQQMMHSRLVPWIQSTEEFHFLPPHCPHFASVMVTRSSTIYVPPLAAEEEFLPRFVGREDPRHRSRGRGSMDTSLSL